MKKILFLLLFFTSINSHAASAAYVKVLSINSGTANTCDTVLNPTSLLNININISAFNSDTFSISAPGFLGFTWTGENGPFNIPNGIYNLAPPSVWQAGFLVPAQTPITATITTYSAVNLGGVPVYKTAITWNCTTGALVSLQNIDLTTPPDPTSVPALSLVALFILGAFVSAFAVKKLLPNVRHAKY